MRAGNAPQPVPLTGARLPVRETGGVFGFVVLGAVLAASVRVAWRERAFRGVALSLLLTVVTATSFYQVHEGWSMLDSLYFCITTGLTIGYGDVVPTTALSKVFTMVYAVTTVGLFVAVSGMLLDAAKRQAGERGEGGKGTEGS